MSECYFSIKIKRLYIQLTKSMQFLILLDRSGGAKVVIKINMARFLPFYKKQENTHSGNCKGFALRIQINTTAYFIGKGFIPNNWNGLNWGFSTPDGYYANFLISPSIPQARWKWYQKPYMVLSNILTFEKK